MKICMVYQDSKKGLGVDSRVLKEVKTLVEAGHEVIIACDEPEDPEWYVDAFGVRCRCIGYRSRPTISTSLRTGFIRMFILSSAVNKLTSWFFNLLRLLFLDIYLNLKPGFMKTILTVRAEVYHVHDLPSLPATIICAFFNQKPVVYDSHEYFSGLATSWWKIKLIKFIEKILVRRCEAVVTVNNSIAYLLREEYNIPIPIVVSNFSYLTPLRRTNVLKKRLNIAKDRIIVLFQGVIYPGKGIEAMIKASKSLPGIEMIIMGYGSEEYRDELKSLATDFKASNVHFLDAVPPVELLDYTASAEIGIVPAENLCYSYYLGLPNRLGEYIMAGIPFAVSDFPEMRKLAIEGDMGVVFDPAKPKEIVKALEELSKPEVYERKRGNVIRARNIYNWENEGAKLIKLYNAIELSLT